MQTYAGMRALSWEHRRLSGQIVSSFEQVHSKQAAQGTNYFGADVLAFDSTLSVAIVVAVGISGEVGTTAGR